MVRFLFVSCSVLLLASTHVLSLSAQQQSTSGSPSQRAAGTPLMADTPQRALLDRYCISCHNQNMKTAGLMLDTLDLSNVSEHADIWEKVVRKLRGNLMPPPGRPRPDKATYDGFASWLESALDRAAEAQPNPGRTETFHRLNRAEYQNVIRDLLALEIDAASLLPADDASYGFDNIAGVLRLDQARVERYLSVAAKISRMAVGTPPPTATAAEFRVSGEARQYERIEGLPFGTRGGLLVRYNFSQDAEYVIRVKLLCRLQGGDCDGAAGFADEHQLEVMIDGERVGLFTLEPRDEPRQEIAPYEVRLPLKGGPRDVGVTFVALPDTQEVESRFQRFQRPFFLIGNVFQQSQVVYQPYVDKVTIIGPFAPSGLGDTPSRRRLFICRPAGQNEEAACAEEILSTLARRAYRRPETKADIQRLLAFYNEGRTHGGFEAGIEMAVRRLLTSPEFLFRIEHDPPRIAPGTNYRISDLEFASRLSFFLWSSIPDDELLDVAARGELQERAVLERQVRRMLADGRSQALVNNFVGQWLQLRNLEVSQPSIPLFPNFDDTLRKTFRQETELLFRSILREDRSVLELLTADYTFMNERLALHYGIPNVQGSHFRRVSLTDTNYRGVLTHGSVLTVTSRPNRTSPVLRGKWILENVLGTPPPPPPAVVPPLPEKKRGARREALPMREQMAEHRANPVCAGCHASIDPLGFALENFDAVGRWRDMDEAFRPIDASGKLPDGTQFDGLASFQEALLSRPERFVATVTEKLLTYALGRGLEYYDMPAVRKIVRETAPGHFMLSSLIQGVANSIPFQMRRAGPPPDEQSQAAQ